MKDLNDIAWRLDLIAELLVTMHPLKPRVTFHKDGRGYDIQWLLRDPAWPVCGDAEEAEHVETPFHVPWGTMQIHPNGDEFYTKG